MAHFENLEGVEGGILRGPVVTGPRAAMKALARYRAVSGVGEFGTWTVWQEDSGAYHCTYSINQSTFSAELVGANKTQVHNWLKEFVPKCHNAT